MKRFIRDGRSPIPKKHITSEIMSKIRTKHTGPEKLLRKELRLIGIKKYQLHNKRLPGRPDISFPKEHIAVFVNGCYWHQCPYCKIGLPKSHIKFWKEKFTKNKIRDRKKIFLLKKNGWKSIVIWECQIKNNPNRAARRMQKEVEIK